MIEGLYYPKLWQMVCGQWWAGELAADDLDQLHLEAGILFLTPACQMDSRVAQLPQPRRQFREAVHGVDLLGSNRLDVFHQFVEVGVIAVGQIGRASCRERV